MQRSLQSGWLFSAHLRTQWRSDAVYLQHSPLAATAVRIQGVAAVGLQKEWQDRESGAGRPVGSCMTWSTAPGEAILMKTLRSPGHCPGLLQLKRTDIEDAFIPSFIFAINST